jgi:hypothetical protein
VSCLEHSPDDSVERPAARLSGQRPAATLRQDYAAAGRARWQSVTGSEARAAGCVRIAAIHLVGRLAYPSLRSACSISRLHFKAAVNQLASRRETYRRPWRPRTSSLSGPRSVVNSLAWHRCQHCRYSFSCIIRYAYQADSPKGSHEKEEKINGRQYWQTRYTRLNPAWAWR